MREIQLSQGKFALVDDDDFDRLAGFRWHAHFDGNNWYARRMVRIEGGGRYRQRAVSMHRVIMNAPDGGDVDHRNGNGLDNQKENLRPCSMSQNQHNQKPRPYGVSRFKGVTWHSRIKKWSAGITVNKRREHLGYFFNETAAALAYNEAARERFGEFARLNVIDVESPGLSPTDEKAFRIIREALRELAIRTGVETIEVRIDASGAVLLRGIRGQLTPWSITDAELLTHEPDEVRS